MKNIIVYLRTSSSNQSIDCQINSAKSYLKSINVDPSTVIYITDQGASLQERKGIKKMLNLIESGKVQTLVTYDRSRIARNFNEYIDISNIFISNNIDVIFTANNELPFGTHGTPEVMNNLIIIQEGNGL